MNGWYQRWRRKAVAQSAVDGVVAGWTECEEPKLQPVPSAHVPSVRSNPSMVHGWWR